jgi:hypothetical protein
MAFKIRRGLDDDRLAYVFEEGELIYTTDTYKLYVGDGETSGGNLVSSQITSVNGKTDTTVSLTTVDIPESGGNFYFSNERAQDAIGTALTTGTHTGISFTYGSTQDNANRIDATVTAVDAGLVNSIAFYQSTSAVVTPTDSLKFNNVSNTLTLESGTFVVQAGNSGRVLSAFDTFSNSSATNLIALRKARGSVTSPLAVTSGDVISQIGLQGYDGTAFQNAVVLSASAFGTVGSGVVPGIFTLSTTDYYGTLIPRFRADDTGRVYIGPYQNIDPGSGSLLVRQSANSLATSTISGRNVSSASSASGAIISLSRFRGTYLAPTATLVGDTLAEIRASGWDGLSGTLAAPTTSLSSSISFVAEGSISAGKIPGSINLKIANTLGTLGTVMKLSNLSSSSAGLVEVTGGMTVSSYVQVGSTGGSGTSVITSPVAGMIILDTSSSPGVFKGYNGSAWVALS